MVEPRRRYEVRGLLGEGAFGSVYLARAVGGGIQREVAIKVLHRERAENPALVGRLRDEARMLALIRHRAIVRVDDLIELDGDWSIVMEYVEGCDVAAVLRGGALAPSVALAIAEEVANALHAAWNQAGLEGAPLRLVHRDIKPGNVRLTAQGEVKLLDFGVARAEFAEREAGTTQTGFGTLIYMAPERFEGRDSHEGDVYALGVCLFEMLTGVTPGKTAGDRDRQPPGSRYAEQWAYIEGLSPDLSALLATMLAYPVEHRPTARDAARALAGIRRELRGERLEDWAARTIPALLAEGGGPSREGARTGTFLTERSRPPTAGTRAPRRVLPWVAGGLSVATLALTVVLVGAGGWWLTHGRAPAAGQGVAEPVGLLSQSVRAGASAGASPPAIPPAPAAASPDLEGVATAVAAPHSATSPSRSVKAAARTPAAPPPEPGRLRVAGDPVKATFLGAQGPVSAGEVPAGTYTAEVAFEGDVSPVTIRDIPVNPGRVTWLTCKADFRNCAVAPQ